MKTTKLILGIALINVFIITKLKAVENYRTTKSAKSILSSFITDDENLTVTGITNGSEISVHVSLNGNEGTMGTLKIYNSSNQLVSQFDVELKSLPNYSTINLNEYASGVYVVELTTNVGVHTTHLTL